MSKTNVLTEDKKNRLNELILEYKLTTPVKAWANKEVRKLLDGKHRYKNSRCTYLHRVIYRLLPDLMDGKKRRLNSGLGEAKRVIRDIKKNTVKCEAIVVNNETLREIVERTTTPENLMKSLDTLTVELSQSKRSDTLMNFQLKIIAIEKTATAYSRVIQAIAIQANLQESYKKKISQKRHTRKI